MFMLCAKSPDPTAPNPTDCVLSAKYNVHTSLHCPIAQREEMVAGGGGGRWPLLTADDTPQVPSIASRPVQRWYRPDNRHLPAPPTSVGRGWPNGDSTIISILCYCYVK